MTIARRSPLAAQGQGGYLRSEEDWLFQKITKPISLNRQIIFLLYFMPEFFYLDYHTEALYTDGVSATIELLQDDTYHVINRQLMDERPRIRYWSMLSGGSLLMNGTHRTGDFLCGKRTVNGGQFGLANALPP